MKGRRTSSRLTDERLAAFRARIRDGGYNDPDVADAVARRILEHGDLHDDAPGPSFTPRRNPPRPIH